MKNTNPNSRRGALILRVFVLILFSVQMTRAQSKDWTNYVTDTHYVKRIDKEKLAEQILQANKKVTLVVIYTNYCGGTEYVLKSVNKIRSTYGDAVNIALCNSSMYKDIPNMLSVLKRFNVKESPVYVIDSEKYKDKKSDDRYKGKLFRDDICQACKREVIGVPYKILFDENGNLLENGYISSETVNAIIEYQLKKDLAASK